MVRSRGAVFYVQIRRLPAVSASSSVAWLSEEASSGVMLVVFPPDSPAPERASLEDGKFVSAFVTRRNETNAITNDLSLETALKQHVRFVYEQANPNQRRTAKLLGISRSTLARYLREAAPN
jgi:DNA-binding NtrC family response regulator